MYASANLDVSILISIHKSVLHTSISSRWMIKIRVEFQKRCAIKTKAVAFGEFLVFALCNGYETISSFFTDMKFCVISWLEFNVTWKSFVWINVMIKLSTWHYCDKVEYLACYCKQGVIRSATHTQSHKYTIWHQSSEEPTIPVNKRGKVFHTCWNSQRPSHLKLLQNW